MPRAGVVHPESAEQAHVVGALAVDVQAADGVGVAVEGPGVRIARRADGLPAIPVAVLAAVEVQVGGQLVAEARVRAAHITQPVGEGGNPVGVVAGVAVEVVADGVELLQVGNLNQPVVVGVVVHHRRYGAGEPALAGVAEGADAEVVLIIGGVQAADDMGGGAGGDVPPVGAVHVILVARGLGLAVDSSTVAGRPGEFHFRRADNAGRQVTRHAGPGFVVDDGQRRRLREMIPVFAITDEVRVPLSTWRVRLVLDPEETDSDGLSIVVNGVFLGGDGEANSGNPVIEFVGVRLCLYFDRGLMRVGILFTILVNVVVRSAIAFVQDVPDGDLFIQVQVTAEIQVHATHLVIALLGVLRRHSRWPQGLVLGECRRSGGKPDQQADSGQGQPQENGTYQLGVCSITHQSGHPVSGRLSAPVPGQSPRGLHSLSRNLLSRVRRGMMRLPRRKALQATGRAYPVVGIGRDCVVGQVSHVSSGVMDAPALVIQGQTIGPHGDAILVLVAHIHR